MSADEALDRWLGEPHPALESLVRLVMDHVDREDAQGLGGAAEQLLDMHDLAADADARLMVITALYLYAATDAAVAADDGGQDPNQAGERWIGDAWEPLERDELADATLAAEADLDLVLRVVARYEDDPLAALSRLDEELIAAGDESTRDALLEVRGYLVELAGEDA